MSKKTNPIAGRKAIAIGWKSRWYASKQDFASVLLEDQKIRNFVRHKKEYKSAGIDRIEIERTREEVKVNMQVARPGPILGKTGDGVELLQEELQQLIGRRVYLTIAEIPRPELCAQLVATHIAEQLQKRVSVRRTMERAVEETMDAGARGIKVQLSGRLGGAEMARREKRVAGSMPLSTLRAKIDYGFAEASTPKGHIGVQVWINQGAYEEQDEDRPVRYRSQEQEILRQHVDKFEVGDIAYQLRQPQEAYYEPPIASKPARFLVGKLLSKIVVGQGNDLESAKHDWELKIDEKIQVLLSKQDFEKTEQDITEWEILNRHFDLTELRYSTPSDVRVYGCVEGIRGHVRQVRWLDGTVTRFRRHQIPAQMVTFELGQTFEAVLKLDSRSWMPLAISAVFPTSALPDVSEEEATAIIERIPTITGRAELDY